jgi:exopolysaccharide biosynthesis WecB/TagA/CpsF family protein
MTIVVPRDHNSISVDLLARIVLHLKTLRCRGEREAATSGQPVPNGDSRRKRRFGAGLAEPLTSRQSRPQPYPRVVVANHGHRGRGFIVSTMGSWPALADRPRLLVTPRVADEPPMKRADKAELLGLAFDAVTMDNAVARCLELCRASRSSQMVITANASHLCMMRRDPELARACRTGHLTVADGMSVVWALRASGQPVPERVAGVDLMARLLAAAGEHHLRVYFLGAKAEVVTALVERCRAQYPGLEIAGFRDGYFGADDHLGIVEEIRASGAHMLFVGMPTPFKETWCERHRQRLDVPVIMGVGGSFDVLAGFIRRAPRWVQLAGLEWFWRLLMEPRKLMKRYLTTNSEFIWLAGCEIIARRLGLTPAAHGQKRTEMP